MAIDEARRALLGAPPSPEAQQVEQLVRQAPTTAKASPTSVGNIASLGLNGRQQAEAAAQLEIGAWVKKSRTWWEANNEDARVRWWQGLNQDEEQILRAAGFKPPTRNRLWRYTKAAANAVPGIGAAVRGLWQVVVAEERVRTQYQRANIAMGDANEMETGTDLEVPDVMGIPGSGDFLEAFVPRTLSPATWKKYWKDAGEDNGEGFFLPSKVQALRDEGIEESTLTLAEELAARISTNKADKGEIEGAFNLLMIELVSDGELSQEEALEKLTRFKDAADDKGLNDAVNSLLGAKISTGRHIANEFDLDPTSEAYQWVSGAGDTANAFADLFWAGGKALKAVRVIKRGVFTPDDVVRKSLRPQVWKDLREQAVVGQAKTNDGRTVGLAKLAEDRIRAAEAITDPAERARALAEVMDPAVYRAYDRIARALNEDLAVYADHLSPGGDKRAFSEAGLTGRVRDRRLTGVARLKAENPKWNKVAERMQAEFSRGSVPGAAPKRLKQEDITGRFVVAEPVGVADVFARFADDAGVMSILNGSMAGHLRHVPVIPFESLAHLPFTRSKVALAQSIDWLNDSPIRMLDKMRRADGMSDEAFEEALSKGVRWDAKDAAKGVVAGQQVGVGRALLVGAEAIAGGILKKAVTFNPGREIDLMDGDASEQVRSLASVMLTPSQADVIVNEFQAMRSSASRARVVRSLYAKVFDNLGVTQTEEGRDWANRFLDVMEKSVGQKLGYNGQVYGIGDHASIVINGKPTAAAIWTAETSTHMALPDLKKLYAYTRRGAMWKKLTGFDLFASDAADFVVGKVWTPFVLMRLGFPIRAGGEEALQFIMREGFGRYMKARVAASKATDKRLLEPGHRLIDAMVDVAAKRMPVHGERFKELMDWRHPEKLFGEWYASAVMRGLDWEANLAHNVHLGYRAVTATPRTLLRMWAPDEYVAAATEISRHSTRIMSREVEELMSTDYRHAEHLPDAQRMALAAQDPHALEQPDEWWRKTIHTGRYEMVDHLDPKFVHKYIGAMGLIAASDEGKIAAAKFHEVWQRIENGELTEEQGREVFGALMIEALEAEPEAMARVLNTLMRARQDERIGRLGGFEQAERPLPKGDGLIGWVTTDAAIASDPVLLRLSQQGSVEEETIDAVRRWRSLQDEIFDASRVEQDVEALHDGYLQLLHFDMSNAHGGDNWMQRLVAERGQQGADEEIEAYLGMLLRRDAEENLKSAFRFIEDVADDGEYWRTFERNFRRYQARLGFREPELAAMEADLAAKYGIPADWFEGGAGAEGVEIVAARAFALRRRIDEELSLADESEDADYEGLASELRTLIRDGEMNVFVNDLNRDQFTEIYEALVHANDPYEEAGAVMGFVEFFDSAALSLSPRKADTPSTEDVGSGPQMMRRKNIPLVNGRDAFETERGIYLSQDASTVPAWNDGSERVYGLAFDGEWKPLVAGAPVERDAYYVLREVADELIARLGPGNLSDVDEYLLPFVSPAAWDAYVGRLNGDRQLWAKIVGAPNADWVAYRKAAGDISEEYAHGTLEEFLSKVVARQSKEVLETLMLKLERAGYTGVEYSDKARRVFDPSRLRVRHEFGAEDLTKYDLSNVKVRNDMLRHVAEAEWESIRERTFSVTEDGEYVAPIPGVLEKLSRGELPTVDELQAFHQRDVLREPDLDWAEHAIPDDLDEFQQMFDLRIDALNDEVERVGAFDLVLEFRGDDFPIPHLGFESRTTGQLVEPDVAWHLDEAVLAEALGVDPGEAARIKNELTGLTMQAMILDDVPFQGLDEVGQRWVRGNASDFLTDYNPPVGRLPQRTWAPESETVTNITEVLYRKPFQLIGEVIDYLSRQPMLVHHYVEGKRLAQGLWGSTPGIKRVLDTITASSFGSGTRLMDARSGVDFIKQIKDEFFSLREDNLKGLMEGVLSGGTVTRGTVGSSLAKVNPKTGEITLDPDAIADDYRRGLAYLRGLHSSPGSAQKKTVMEQTEVDVDALKAWFDDHGGAEAYENFILAHERAHLFLDHKAFDQAEWLDEPAITQEVIANDLAFIALGMPFGDPKRASKVVHSQIKTLEVYAKRHPDWGDFDAIMKEAEAAGIQRSDDMSDVDYLERVFDRVWEKEQQIFQTAFMHAVNKVTPHIDNKAVRSFLATVGRNVMPFWWAEERFYKRTAQTLFHSPETLMKAQLGYKGLVHAGFIQQDEKGEDYFVYPGVDTMMWLTTRGLNLVTGGDYKEFQKTDEHGNVIEEFDDYLQVRGKTQLALPGVDTTQMGKWSPSPLIAVPMRMLSHMFPEISGVTDQLAGEFAASDTRETWELILPSTLIRLLQIPNAKEHYASAQNEAVKVLLANGFDPESESPREVEDFMANVHELTQTIAGLRVIYGFVGPAPPEIAFETLEGPSKELFDLTATYGFEEGIQLWQAKHPDASAYSVLNSYTGGGGSIPATDAAYEWMREHESFITDHPLIASYLYPVPQSFTTDEFSFRAWQKQYAVGLRHQRTEEEIYRAAKFAEAAPAYFATKEEVDRMRALTKGTEARAIVEQRWRDWKNQYKKAHPTFFEELESSHRRERRQSVLDDLADALDDPNLPEGRMVDALREVHATYTAYLQVREKLSVRDTNAHKAARQEAKARLVEWMVGMIDREPALEPFFQRVVMPELRIDDADLEEAA